MTRSGASMMALFVCGILLWVIAMWRPSVDDALAVIDDAALPLTAAAAALPGPAASVQNAGALTRSTRRPLAPVVPAQDEQQPAHDPTELQPTTVVDPSLTPPPEMLGPIDERKQTFASEPRDSSASESEQLVRDAFQQRDIPPGLYRSIMCRKTICRLELRWRPERADAYMVGLMRIMTKFEPGMAVDPTRPDSSGEHQIDVYLKRLVVTPEQLD